MFLENSPISDIAFLFNVDISTIQNIITEHYNLERRMGELTYSLFRMAKELYQLGKYPESMPTRMSYYKRMDTINKELAKIRKKYLDEYKEEE